MRGIFVYLLFAVAGAIFGGAGLLIQLSVNKIKKNKWIKFLPAICLLVWLGFIMIKPVFFFNYVIAGFALLGTVIGLVLYYRSNRKEN